MHFVYPDGDLDIDSIQLGLYSGWRRHGYYLNGQAGFGYHWVDAQRSVAVGDFGG